MVFKHNDNFQLLNHTIETDNIEKAKIQSI